MSTFWEDNYFWEWGDDFLEFLLNFLRCIFGQAKFLDKLLESFHELLDSARNGAFLVVLLVWIAQVSLSDMMLGVLNIKEHLIGMIDWSYRKSIFWRLILYAWLDFLLFAIIQRLLSVWTSVSMI